MADEKSQYKLIHAVDPTKVNVPIREKFSKLTLSSNKKQCEIAKLERNEHDIENRKSVSRNLLDSFSASAAAAMPVSSSGAGNYVNPLLRSDSSHSSISCGKVSVHPPDGDETQINVNIEAEELDPDYSALMEPLQLSEDIIQQQGQIDSEINILSYRVSCMAVSNEAPERSQIVPVTSQRMSSDLKLTQVQGLMQVSPTSANKDVSPCILLSSEGESDDSVGDETCSAITVTDSSDAEEPDVDIDYELVTSEIPLSGGTADAFLPTTFSNDQANRLEAFLRDVSLERQEMISRGDLLEQIVVVQKEPAHTELESDTEKEKRARRLANADTESMSPLQDIERSQTVAPIKSKQLQSDDTLSMCQTAESWFTKDRNAVPGKSTNILANDDTLSLDQDGDSLFAIETKTGRSSMKSHSAEGNNAYQLALDDTEPNTFISNAEVKDNSCVRSSTSTPTIHANDLSALVSDESSIANSLPSGEASIVIPETSSEAESFSNSADESNKKVILSEPTPVQRDNVDSASLLESQLSQIQVSMGSINISAKINIKIQISQQADSEEEPPTSEDDDGADADDEENDNDKSIDAPALTNSTENERHCEQMPMENLINYPREDESASTNVDPAPNANFLSQAEKLLTEIYGSAWRTPVVMRTLKRTSASDKKITKSVASSSEKPATPAHSRFNSAETPKTRTTSRTARAHITKNRTLKTPGDEDKGVSRGSASESTPKEKTPQSSKKKGTKTKTPNVSDYTPQIKVPNDERITKATETPRQAVEDSILDDFSFFRQNIERTNLDSTRLNDNKNPAVAPNSEPRCRPKFKHPQRNDDIFKVPQTEVKKRTIVTARGRLINDRWRRLIGDYGDSQGAHIKDDKSVDETDDDTASSDHSWSKGSSDEENDSDLEICGAAPKGKSKRTKARMPTKVKDQLIYLDLTKDEVSVKEGSSSTPPANNDEHFNMRLQEILLTCQPVEKSKLEATPTSAVKPKRKLFTINFGDEEDQLPKNEPRVETPKSTRLKVDEELLEDLENLYPNGVIPTKFDVFNKQLEAIKTGKPIFKLTPPRSANEDTPTRSKTTLINTQTPKSARTKPNERLLDKLAETPDYKYGFLKSLDVCVGKTLCHPDALIYRENFRTKKEELSSILYSLYNEKLFDNKLNVPLVWNKKLLNTAGRCLNKKKVGTRSSVVELSEKVLTSADRLRCTLIHELCHAATWIFNGEGGHGSTWKEWARKANTAFPEIPKIGVCHQYDIEYKYTYKCTLCGAKSHAHSKSKKVENIRCAYCHGAIEIFLNKKDKQGNIMPTPVKEPTGFAKFVRDNYKRHKRDDLKHADVMRLLSNEFASLKVTGK